MGSVRTIWGLSINLISSAPCSHEWHLILETGENFLPPVDAGPPQSHNDTAYQMWVASASPPSCQLAGQRAQQTCCLIGFCVLRTGGKLPSAQVALEKAGKRDALWATSSPFFQSQPGTWWDWGGGQGGWGREREEERVWGGGVKRENSLTLQSLE